MKNVISCEIDGVGSVPQETLLSRIEMNVDVNPAGLERERNLTVHLFLANNFPAVHPSCGTSCFFGGECCCRWSLLLRRAPSRGDMALQLLVGSVGAR